MTHARHARTRPVALAALVALAGAGCSASADAPAVTSPAPAVTTEVQTTAPALSTVPATSPTPAPASSAPRTTASSSTASRPPSSAAPPRSTCTSVSVRVIRGSASLGQEIAALQFTNSGPSSCVLVGFPTVTLLRNGNQIGQSSQPSSARSSRTLRPGEVAESLLHDYTQTCQAPLSDSIRVVVPGMNTTAIRPAQLRACIVRVDRLGPAE